MTVRQRRVKGQNRWVIDRAFRCRDGSVLRYRRVAKIQSKADAFLEEARLVAHWDTHGGLPDDKRSRRRCPGPASDSSPKKLGNATWEDAIEHYKTAELPRRKYTTAQGYLGVLSGPHMRYWAGRLLAEITRREIEAWDLKLIDSQLSSSTRRNHHIVLRAVLRSVGPEEDDPGVLLDQLPGFPKLPKVGQVEVDAPSAEDVTAIINEQDPPNVQTVVVRRRRAVRLAFALAAYAGLRASEVRGLKVHDVNLRRLRLTVRQARTGHVEFAPKSGHQRSIPIAKPLALLLAEAIANRKPDDYVVVLPDGRAPTSNTWMGRHLNAACKRLDLTGARYHSLRHFFATILFAEGRTDAKTVQRLLGHLSLAVTERYAHHSKERERAAVNAVWGSES